MSCSLDRQPSLFLEHVRGLLCLREIPNRVPFFDPQGGPQTQGWFIAQTKIEALVYLGLVQKWRPGQPSTRRFRRLLRPVPAAGGEWRGSWRIRGRRWGATWRRKPFGWPSAGARRGMALDPKGRSMWYVRSVVRSAWL